MNKITREHYPASKLPEDLREGVDPSSMVTVTVAIEEGALSRPRQNFKELLAQARRLPPADDDPVARIRELRDEWDD